MKIDNKKSIYSIWLQKLISTIILAPLIIGFSFADYFRAPFLGIDRLIWIILFCLIYVGVIFLHRIRNPYFIFYSDNGRKITLRYFPVNAFNKKKHSIEIPKDKFVRFEIHKGSRYNSIVLYQKFKNGVGKYPPISLSAFRSNDLKALKSSLSQYVKK